MPEPNVEVVILEREVQVFLERVPAVRILAQEDHRPEVDEDRQVRFEVEVREQVRDARIGEEPRVERVHELA
jgi:hypothetical protein